ncbi:hypothetical protein RFI_16168 [Reticulomyxa filosa]|uniref:RNA helicase n=1 Tax=Reticulomyxa filosa TaxID=46433 RepID=X6N4T1_RETFI|nr:hypothetical protein RFI_16168 [Reticulomyxa filosa]|eukprot:ETO21036.1 hypothetical protein RFI_16168 [Reticulomyxa filosa]
MYGMREPTESSFSGPGLRSWSKFDNDDNRFGNEKTKKLEQEMERQLFETGVSQGINFDMYDKIPVELSGSNPPKAISSFREAKLHKQLEYNVEQCKFAKPTPVQKYAIPSILTGRDMMACAQTGSGKTAAFILPIAHQMLERRSSSDSGNNRRQSSFRSRVYPRAIILAPTRELAIQTEEQTRKFLWKTGMTSVVVYGGVQTGKQLRDLRNGCEIIVATPGRLHDFIMRGVVCLDAVEFCVLDEGDRMLDMGFMPQVNELIQKMPKKGERQMLMFSATFPPEIQKLAQEFLQDYLFLAVGRVGSTNSFIRQTLVRVNARNKFEELVKLLQDCKGLCLVFVGTKRDAGFVENQLVREGLDAISIHGDRSQEEREHALAVFRNGKCPILVATDVAARGLDIPSVMWVINYDLPNNIEDYVHRIGRTGRCGNSGNAISFVTDSNANILKDLIHLLQENKQEIPGWCEEMAQGRGGGYYRGRSFPFGRRPGHGEKDFRRSQPNYSNNFVSQRFNEGYRDRDAKDDEDDKGKHRHWNHDPEGDTQNDNGYSRSSGNNRRDHTESFGGGKDSSERDQHQNYKTFKKIRD